MRTWAVALGAVVAVAAVAVTLHFQFGGNSRAKEGKGKSGPPPVPVTVEAVRLESVPVRLGAIGNVEASSSVAVRSRVDGQIVAVNFREGQEVKRGEVLFRIDPRPFQAALKQAEANALRDAASRDQARSQERRYQELLQKNFISREAYAQIATNAQTAEATARASEAVLENARLNLEYCTIVSPLEGYPGKALLQVGNMVRANDANALVVVNQVRPIYVNFAVPEQNLPEVRQYQSQGPLAVQVVPVDPQQKAAQGRLVFIDNAVDQSTGTIRMRAEFANADAGLWPGQFVNVNVRLYQQEGALVIPAQAVQSGPEGQYVYVIGEDMIAQVRRITVQRADTERAIVAKGLEQGERVVTRGQLRLGPKVRVQLGKPAAGAAKAS